MNIVGFIPARGGSKGIPEKNLIELGGTPLIGYTLEAAQKSKSITKVFVSSDADKIIDFCKGKGVDVPYKRPEHIARDTTPMMETILHGLQWLENEGCKPDIVVLLQPTSPFRSAEDIDRAVNYFLEKKARSLISVHKMTEHPYDCIHGEGSNWNYLAKPDGNPSRRQDYDDNYYFINGALYIAYYDFLKEKKTFEVEGETEPFILEPVHGIDIDEIYDLKLAEFFLKYWKPVTFS